MPDEKEGKRRSFLLPDSVHLPAATVMSASPSIDAYDAQMLDFPSDTDVPMNITGSAEFLAEALMDHDDHLAASAYGDHASVEVDMEEYVGENAEYEMADETVEYHDSIGEELLDIEVYDASHAPSPFVPPQPLHPSVEVPIDSQHPAPTSPAFSDHAAPPDSQGEVEQEERPLHPAGDVAHVDPSASGEHVSSEAAPLELAHSTEATDESVFAISESREQLGDARSVEQPLETQAPVGAADEAEPHDPPPTEARAVDSEVAQHETPELPTAESATLASAEEEYDSGPLVQDEQAADQTLSTEGETVDPLHISDGVYIDPPPAVLLSISDPSQPGFVLFSQHDAEGEPTGESHGHQEARSLLLENRPTLYYEPLSSVFEALRQDEALLSRVPHSFEGELVLDAYDLQLAVSEDNVHSREISLHDLNVLHDGSDFVGPLRLFLRAIVPRFIIRYYALQEQLQRQNVVTETAEGDHDEEPQEEYDTGEEQRLPQEEGEPTALPSSVVSGGLPVTEAEEPVNEPSSSPEETEETPQEHYELGDSSSVQDLAAEYHEVTGEAAHALVDEDDYEGTNAGDEDEAAKCERLDADQVHDTAAEDTDAPATVTGQGSEFGGEQPEYLDFVQPEEYDDRYGEDLPERAGGASPVQYGQPPYYEEGEQDASTAVDESQETFPDLDEHEEAEENTAPTPVPARTALESESSEPTDDNTTDLSVFAKQENSVPSREEISASELANESVDTKQTGIRETDTLHAKAFSEVDESDSNFVSMLEHEADTEPKRTFSTEQNKQEGSIESAPEHESIWDEWADEDAEGEDEEDWIDPDAASNESSVTLDSKASSKRSYDEVDPSEEIYVENPHVSPDSKRPRVH